MTEVDEPDGSDSRPQPDESDTSKAVIQYKLRWSLSFLFYRVSDLFYILFCSLNSPTTSFLPKL